MLFALEKSVGLHLVESTSGEIERVALPLWCSAKSCRKQWKPSFVEEKMSPCHFCYSLLRWGPLEDSSAGVGGIWNQIHILIGCLQMLALIPVNVDGRAGHGRS